MPHPMPPSLQTLRALGARAGRDRASREVFHDALLETYGDAYEGFVREAHRQAKWWARQGVRSGAIAVFFLTLGDRDRFEVGA